jgi:hypothetical protein
MTLALIFLRRWWPFLLIGALLAALALGWVHWLHGHDDGIRRQEQLAARDTVIQMRTDTAAARSTERRVDSVSVTRILTQIRHDTLWRRDTVRIDGDTTTRLAIPLGVVTEHDTAFARCERLNRSCAREHAADSLVIDQLRQSLAIARIVTVTPPPHLFWKERALWTALGAVIDRGVHQLSH